MTDATTPLILPVHQPEAPSRSPRTSVVLAELTRQRRWDRRQRRQARARRAIWLTLLDGRPFESVRTHTAPCLLFAGNLPLVWSPDPAGFNAMAATTLSPP